MSGLLKGVARVAQSTTILENGSASSSSALIVTISSMKGLASSWPRTACAFLVLVRDVVHDGKGEMVGDFNVACGDGGIAEQIAEAVAGPEVADDDGEVIQGESDAVALEDPSGEQVVVGDGEVCGADVCAGEVAEEVKDVGGEAGLLALQNLDEAEGADMR